METMPVSQSYMETIPVSVIHGDYTCVPVIHGDSTSVSVRRGEYTFVIFRHGRGYLCFSLTDIDNIPILVIVRHGQSIFLFQSDIQNMSVRQRLY